MKIGVLVVGALAAVAAQAQSGLGFFNPLSASRDGIHLYGVSVYGGYFTGGVPFQLPTLGTLPLINATAVSGGSVELGWRRVSRSSSLSVSQSLAFMVYPQQLFMPNIVVALNGSRKLTDRWTLNLTATGQLMDLRQSFFTSNAFGQAASLPTTFDSLSSAMLTRKFTDVQLSSVLTGSAAQLTPEQAQIYGQRVASATVTASFEHTASGRSSIHGSVSATRSQRINSSETASAIQAVIPQSTAATASVGWGYSLSPRTHIGVDTTTTRAFSRVQDGYASTGSFSVGTTMSEHWFIQGRIGAGHVTYLKQADLTPPGIQYTAGGSLGYKRRSHTLLGSFDRTLGDSYGLGSTSTYSATAGWAWKQPGSRWSVSANYGYQQLNGTALRSTESWRATGGIGRALAQQVFVSLQYAYFVVPTNSTQTGGLQRAQSGVTAALSWSPSPYR